MGLENKFTHSIELLTAVSDIAEPGEWLGKLSAIEWKVHSCALTCLVRRSRRSPLRSWSALARYGARKDFEEEYKLLNNKSHLCDTVHLSASNTG